jgi:hypothetical protein
MRKRRRSLPSKKEEQGRILPRMIYLTPLLDLVLHLLEIILKWIGIIK